MSNIIELKYSNIHGSGVFATQKLLAKTIVEICEVDLYPRSLDILPEIRFVYSPEEFAICRGLGSMYNHSDTPNAEKYPAKVNGRKVLVFQLLRSVAPGEELTHKYRDVNFKLTNK